MCWCLSACFNGAQSQSTRDAGVLASLKVMRAIAHGMDKKTGIYETKGVGDTRAL